MSTTTALDIINGSLRILQTSSPDTTLPASEANDALDALNMVLDAWSNESMMLHHITKEQFNLVAGQAQYTIGTGGDFNTTRPTNIEAATITINNSEFSVSPIAYDDWAVIRLKSIAAYPEYLYLDAAFPLGTVNLYPTPSTATVLTVYSRKPFTQFSSLTATFSLPPGYSRALKYQLAIELAPEYQTAVGADVINLAMGAKASIKRTNKRSLTSQVDLALLGGKRSGFNVFRGS